MKNAYLLRQIACESDGKSDYSSITDDGYLVSNEETGTILWQHVKFYIVHNPVRGPHHILAPREAPYLLKSSRDSTCALEAEEVRGDHEL
ncbi:hypothetical protein MPDQ_005345 [Monascus purpureus]|uniref:Uncharacterized protein n=1 Tax=Monascus purpureus TaxID=5098 RepID=A0A507QKP9_MONPU|nr:hypothetical protein MPDQ_005345 [Monascus purpureus]